VIGTALGLQSVSSQPISYQEQLAEATAREERIIKALIAIAENTGNAPFRR
jgi:hypothetical protein